MLVEKPTGISHYFLRIPMSLTFEGRNMKWFAEWTLKYDPMGSECEFVSCTMLKRQ
jgi:hypothetical protein